MDIRLTNEKIFLDVSSAGAEMQSLRDAKGREYLWDGSDFWKRHAPYLFPIVGGLEKRRDDDRRQGLQDGPARVRPGYGMGTYRGG